jgi:hypothetical protein
MPSRPRTTFDKLQKERARQEKQAAKRARRHSKHASEPGGRPDARSDDATPSLGAGDEPAPMVNPSEEERDA